MLDSSPTPLAEIVRVPSPAPMNQSLAHDGERLWVGSWETSRLYAVDATHGNVTEEHAVPGKPVGSTVVGNELRFVVAQNGDDDNRFIRRFIPGHGFTSREATPCPEDTGSFLAYDGERLWLSQRHNKRVLELDAQLQPVRTIDVGEEVIGLAWADERLYLSTWHGKERGGCHVGYLETGVAEPKLQLVLRSPFVAVSLARDGERLWTNDYRKQAVVAFAIPR